MSLRAANQTKKFGGLAALFIYKKSLCHIAFNLKPKGLGKVCYPNSVLTANKLKTTMLGVF